MFSHSTDFIKTIHLVTYDNKVIEEIIYLFNLPDKNLIIESLSYNINQSNLNLYLDYSQPRNEGKCVIIRNDVIIIIIGINIFKCINSRL